MFRCLLFSKAVVRRNLGGLHVDAMGCNAILGSGSTRNRLPQEAGHIPRCEDVLARHHLCGAMRYLTSGSFQKQPFVDQWIQEEFETEGSH